jgi:hypothetical protein
MPPPIPADLFNEPVSYTVTPLPKLFATLHPILRIKSTQPDYKIVVVFGLMWMKYVAKDLLGRIGDIGPVFIKVGDEDSESSFPQDRGVQFTNYLERNKIPPGVNMTINMGSRWAIAGREGMASDS